MAHNYYDISQWYLGFFPSLLLYICYIGVYTLLYIHIHEGKHFHYIHKIIPDVIDTSLFCVYVPTNTFLLVQLDNNNNNNIPIQRT